MEDKIFSLLVPYTKGFICVTISVQYSCGSGIKKKYVAEFKLSHGITDFICANFCVLMRDIFTNQS